MIKKEVFCWSLYDLADTAFSALFITFFFPVLIKVYLGGTEFDVGLSMGLAMLLSAILVPIIGAWSDAVGRRKPFILAFTLLCIATLIATAFANLGLALVLGAIAAFFYHSALDVYDALLTRISTPKTIGRISGIGVAFGYLGTILSLGMAYLILHSFGYESKASVQVIFIATGAFYLFFSSFLFFGTPDERAKRVKVSTAVRNAVSAVIKSFKTVRKNRFVWLFMLASLLYTDGMNTAIVFLYLFGRQALGISIQQFFPLFAVMAFAAGLGALLFGKITDKLTPKRTLLVLVGLWTAVIAVLLIKTNIVTYMIAGIVGGTALGGVWAATRPMLVGLVPKKMVAEYLGFQGLTEKLSGAIGPVVFGWLVVVSGYPAALASMLVFFVIGFGILLGLPDNRAQ